MGEPKPTQLVIHQHSARQRRLPRITQPYLLQSGNREFSMASRCASSTHSSPLKRHVTVTLPYSKDSSPASRTHIKRATFTLTRPKLMVLGGLLCQFGTAFCWPKQAVLDWLRPWVVGWLSNYVQVMVAIRGNLLSQEVIVQIIMLVRGALV